MQVDEMQVSELPVTFYDAHGVQRPLEIFECSYRDWHLVITDGDIYQWWGDRNGIGEMNDIRQCMEVFNFYKDMRERFAWDYLKVRAPWLHLLGRIEVVIEQRMSSMTWMINVVRKPEVHLVRSHSIVTRKRMLERSLSTLSPGSQINSTQLEYPTADGWSTFLRNT